MPDGCDGLIGRTAEAVVFTWERAAVPGRRCAVAPVRRRVEALSAAGVDVAVVSQAGAAHVDGQLRSRPPGPGRLLLCASRGSEMFKAGPEGLRLMHRRAGGLTGRSDSMRDILSFLAGRGVGPGLVLVVGDEFGSLDGVAGRASMTVPAPVSTCCLAPGGLAWRSSPPRLRTSGSWTCGQECFRIPDDPAAQLALRFALFQLWSNTKSGGELAVGARGLSGTGYAGHVFWDADVFVLPAVVSIDPAAAAAMIRYRARRLGAARARARSAGRRGACFPWESAASGEDVTPASVRLGGRVVPVLTGQLEEHVTADVAWAASRYAEWTGRPARLALPLLLETAGYWASRCRLDDAGDAHIDGVIGPDEYHERVNDNAYTNVMARWNLRAAADAADRAGLANAESRRWRDLAERIVDGHDPATGRYEQFAGYYGLEPLLVADFAAPPVAADLLLGRERVAGSQVIKQPDVLMLHHLVPNGPT